MPHNKPYSKAEMARMKKSKSKKAKSAPQPKQRKKVGGRKRKS